MSKKRMKTTMRHAGGFSTRGSGKSRQTLRQKRVAWIVERRFVFEEIFNALLLTEAGNFLITEGSDNIITEGPA